MMRTVLDPNSAARLARICGLFGSVHDGERAAAAAKADTMVRAVGLTWHDVIGASPPLQPAPSPQHWRSMAAYCRACHDMLSPREQEFVHSGEPSEKQRGWLENIYSRLACEAAQ